jgi:hypothetical protein
MVIETDTLSQFDFHKDTNMPYIATQLRDVSEKSEIPCVTETSLEA